MITCKDIINKRKELWLQHKDIEKDIEFRDLAAQRLVDPTKGKELREEIKKQPELLIELFMVVVDKEQNTVPMFLNEVQQEFIDTLNGDIKLFQEGKLLHLQYLILKGRQQGFTTVITALQLAYSIIQKNFAGFTMAHDSESTESIFSDKAKFMFDNLPEVLKPTTKANNRRELHFAKEDGTGLNSRWRVTTAGNKSAGRSKTINFFHGSESAFWDSITSVMTGLKAAITKSAIQILESTANGFNEYKDLWDDDGNNWRKLFFEWWKTKEYRLSFETEKIEKKFKEEVNKATAEENPNLRGWVLYRCQWLLENFNLDWEQLYWYYHQWKDYKAKIKQEYPCTAEESFLASGESIFDVEKVVTRIKVLEKRYKETPFITGYFNYELKYNIQKDKHEILDNTIEWVNDPNGYIVLYDEPQQGYPYVVGGDTAGEPGKESDFFTGQVINNITGKQVAVLRHRMGEDQYADQMYCLGKHYNDALLSIEANYTRYPIRRLHEMLEYPKFYLRKEEDSLTQKPIMKPGFLTTTITRPLIIANLVKIVRENIELFNDIETLKEMLTFVVINNKPQAMEGKKDDLVMAAAIGYHSRPEQSMEIVKTTKLPRGYYTQEELEDMGYKKHEIRKIMEGQRSWK